MTDVNGTRYHLIYGASDWAACLAKPQGLQPLGELWALHSGGGAQQAAQEPPDWDESRAEVVLPSRIFQFNRAPADIPPRLSDRRGAAGDMFGNLYWISDDEQGIQVRSAGSGKGSTFWTSAPDGAPAAPPRAGGFQPLQPEAQPPRPLRLCGLAVTHEHYLVAGVLTPPGLLVFDLHGGGAPQQLVWPAAPEGVIPFAPFDMAARLDGGIWILDRQASSPPVARLWALDRRLNVIDLNLPAAPPAAGPSDRPDFEPLHPAAGDSAAGKVIPPAPGLSYAAAVLVRSGDPQSVGALVAVEALQDHSALILDNAGDGALPVFSHILRCSPAGKMQPDGQALSTGGLKDKIEPEVAKTFSLAGVDFVFLPAAGAGAPLSPGPSGSSSPWGTLVIIAQDGNQAYAFTTRAVTDPPGPPSGTDLVPISLSAEPVYLPMRLFGGRGLVAGSGGPGGAARAYYDSGPQAGPVNWVPLVEQKRPRYQDQADLYTPLLSSLNSGGSSALRSALDGGLPDCTWHRLLVDGCLPPGTQVQVWSRAANSENELALSAWQAEPQPYQRGDGSELPFAGRMQGVNQAGSPLPSDGIGTFELLFQQARGRYLQLWIRLVGDGRTTPRLGALRIYYPRFSYLEHYLPAVYRQEPSSASFLERFLANLEGLYTGFEERIASMQVLFDERTIPGEFLDWLAGWFGTVFDSNWEEERKRLFLAHAAELYSLRGTPLGLVRMVRLATDACPSERIFSETLEYVPGRRPSAVRIVEAFRTRTVPGVVFGDPSIPETPALQLGGGPEQPWTPAWAQPPCTSVSRKPCAGCMPAIWLNLTRPGAPASAPFQKCSSRPSNRSPRPRPGTGAASWIRPCRSPTRRSPPATCRPITASWPGAMATSKPC